MRNKFNKVFLLKLEVKYIKMSKEQLLMTITLHHIFFDHCVLPRSKTITFEITVTSEKMVRGYYCLIIMLTTPLFLCASRVSKFTTRLCMTSPSSGLPVSWLLPASHQKTKMCVYGIL